MESTDGNMIIKHAPREKYFTLFPSGFGDSFVGTLFEGVSFYVAALKIVSATKSTWIININQYTLDTIISAHKLISPVTL